MVMRWEKVLPRHWLDGPGARWGHTCNTIKGGTLLYVFGGFGRDQCQTNQVHVLNAATAETCWIRPAMKGTPPVPRDSHSCTTVGDDLFIFGGTDGKGPLNDLHILRTSDNTWISPCVSGQAPEPRESHSAALIGKGLFIFGGCGKSEDGEIYYDDVYILNTETFVWTRVYPSGTPPSKRFSHTCSSWQNKIIVIGGEDSSNYYLSDIHILDADTLVWCKLNTNGVLLRPRAGHTTINLGKYFFVFGGFSYQQNLLNDLYMLNIETRTWMEVPTMGPGPSGRFSMAGESLDPHMDGILVLIGGCNKNLEPLDDMYFFHTEFSKENDRDERRIEKLSLRKQLKQKFQEQQAGTSTSGYKKVSFAAEPEYDTTVYRPVPLSTYMPAGMQNLYSNEHQTPIEKRTFQAKVTKSFNGSFEIATIIDGRPLRGVLFSYKQMNSQLEALNIKEQLTDVHVEQTSEGQSEKPLQHDTTVARQADGIQNEEDGSEAQVPGASEAHLAPAGNAGSDAANDEEAVFDELFEVSVVPFL